MLWDIETSHNLVLSFGLRDQNIPPENVITHRFIYCASYRWYGEKKTHTLSILDDEKRFKKNKRDDYYVVNELHKILSVADAHVAHYGDGFDMPIFTSRMIVHKIPPLPKIISLDTKKLASRHFGFSSNKLDFISKFLGHKGKIHNPSGLWLKCWDGDEKALRQMARYNRGDIDALYFVFEKLMPYIKNVPINATLFRGGYSCPNPTCGSTKLTKRGFHRTRVSIYQRFQCSACGAWCDDRTALKQEQPPKVK